MEKSLPEWFGSSIFKHWHCTFPFDKAAFEKRAGGIVVQEPRLEQLAKRIDVKGLRVLELGCLEGLHSLILDNLGAREIIAVEGRQENYLKCLIAKNAFHLDRCTFLLGDLHDILPALTGRFDLCVALGILYHLANPVEVVYRLARMSDCVFIWTHYISGGFTRGRHAGIRYGEEIYRGEYMGEDAAHYLSGLEGKSFWLCEDDLLKLLADAGFKNTEVIAKEQHAHGPAMTLLAKK